MLIGRQRERAVIGALVERARSGSGGAVCLVGEPGIGKSTLLDATAADAADFRRLRTVGIESEFELGYAGLADVLGPLRSSLDELPLPQREALEMILGWSSGFDGRQQRYLVAAATLSLLPAAAADTPLLVIVDDLQWVDRESVTALMFAARRLDHDRVALLFAQRVGGEQPAIPCLSLPGFDRADCRKLLGASFTDAVLDHLVVTTAGNPLALRELGSGLSPEQRRGSAAMPPEPPLDQRLTAGFAVQLDLLSASARRAALLIALSADGAAGPVAAALESEGVPVVDALAEVEKSAVVQLAAGRLTFRHPLVRTVLLGGTSAAERRSAHGSLAAALGDYPELRARHRAEAAIGYDDEVATELMAVAAQERHRRGYAAAATLAERAAELCSDPLTAADCRVAAVEDALVSGDVQRIHRLAAVVLDRPAGDEARARALLVLGTLEQYAGSVPRAGELLETAIRLGRGPARIRALAELASVSYRLSSPGGMAAAAAALDELADRNDPEQAMLAAYTAGAALAFTGDWAAARSPSEVGLALLESDPQLRDDPRYLAHALLAPAWLGEPQRVLEFVDRRLDTARSLGALGVLPLALSLVAGGTLAMGWHELAYAYAGEAVELGEELGYVADLAISYELLTWELAARGDHEQAAAALERARILGRRAGVATGAVNVELVDAFAALCRGDLVRVIDVLEHRIVVDGGRLQRGDYPLGVAPDLVEAYLGVGRRTEAAALAGRFVALYADDPTADIRGMAARLAGMVADEETTADAAFAAAHREHAAGSNAFEAARTALMHGARLRRAGQRVAARTQLRAAETAFGALGLDGWSARARTELSATGEQSRRGPQTGDHLTSQETRVGVMVARGLSNKEIASALFLSPKTVEHHVTSALRKRGLRSRTELAVAFAAQHAAGG